MSNNQENVRETLKLIPSVDDILKDIPSKIPISYYKEQINIQLDLIRKEILNGKKISNVKKYCMDKIKNLSHEISSNSLKSVINGTGIILHTGLGRAPISKEILIDSVNKNYPYSNLELDIKDGKRGDRNAHVSSLLNSICQSEKTIVVNNNAAAVILMLNSICQDKEVIISRGQLVEIGGSFRIPEIMIKSQCKMVEVGSTNKTHLSDYENNINQNTAAILYVHTSNYKVVGFTNEINIKELSVIAKNNNLPLLVDLGSGCIADFDKWGLPMQKLVSSYINLGADIITFSGDKLLGGPQAGIITGNKELIQRMYENPFYRSFRLDKIRISILETILRSYYSVDNVDDINLTILLFKRSQKELRNIAKNILKKFKKTNNYSLEFINSEVEAGSGSLPTRKIPSVALTIKSEIIKPNEIYKKFLNAKYPVVGYIKEDLFHVDLKAIPKDQISSLEKSMNEVLL